MIDTTTAQDTPQEPEWREERGPSCTYRVHRDGRVAAYGRERDSAVPNAWRATAWTKHPQHHDDASYKDLCGDVSHAQLMTYLDEWAAEGSTS